MSINSIHTPSLAHPPRPAEMLAEALREQDHLEAERGTASVSPASMTEYFFDLQQKYPGLSFSLGTGQRDNGINNVAMSPVILEKMTASPSEASYYEGQFKKIEQAVSWLENHRETDGLHLKAHGTIIESNGGINSWSVTEPLTAADSPQTRPQKTLGADIQQPRTLEQALAGQDTSETSHLGNALYARYLQNDKHLGSVPHKGSLLKIAG